MGAISLFFLGGSRREYERFPSDVHFELRVEGSGQTFQVGSHNMSGSGILITSTIPLPVAIFSKVNLIANFTGNPFMVTGHIVRVPENSAAEKLKAFFSPSKEETYDYAIDLGLLSEEAAAQWQDQLTRLKEKALRST